MSAEHCIGWPGDCPAFDNMHGCAIPVGRPHNSRPHQCACGTLAPTSAHQPAGASAGGAGRGRTPAAA